MLASYFSLLIDITQDETGSRHIVSSSSTKMAGKPGIERFRGDCEDPRERSENVSSPSRLPCSQAAANWPEPAGVGRADKRKKGGGGGVM